MTDLHYLSATEVLRAFRARELSPVEVLDAVIGPGRGDRAHGQLPARARPRRPPGSRRRGGRALRRQGRTAPPAGGPAGRAQGGAADRRPQPALRLAAHRGPGRRRDPPGPRAGLRRRAPWSTPAPPHRSSPAPASPTATCGASPATRGTPTTRRAAPRAARARPWPPARRTWPAGRTSVARSGSPRRSAAWSASRRRTAGCRPCRPSTSTSTATTARWAARSPTPRCSTT